MKIYLDNCCYGRYVDDLSQGQNREELNAVKHIIGLCRIEAGLLFSSDLNYYEANKITDDEEREIILSMINKASFIIDNSEEIFKRADTFEKYSIDTFDAQHLASAETKCDLFFTVDYRFLRKTKKIEDLNINCYNPLHWVKMK
jgi:predicted nucleic acid-binding protein